MVTTSRSNEPTSAPADAATPPVDGDRPGLAARVLGSGWIPAALVACVAVAMLLAFHTPVLDVARYAAYLGYGLVLPGTLLWRSLRGTPRSFLEDVAAGTAVGYAVELLVYFVVSVFGAPILVAAWPAVVIVAFLAVPRLRRHWRPTGAPRMPVGWSWSVAAMAGFALAWLAWSGFLLHPLSGAGMNTPYVDATFHLSLIGELRHHFPPKVPWVTGEPVSYHWFVHAHMAASSWVTAIEPQVILFRLFAIPLVVLTVVLTAILGSRISGRLWAGPVAAALYVLVGSFSPYAWAWFGPSFTDTSLLLGTLWGSPTQTYGMALFLPVVLLLVDRLRREPGAGGQWLLFALVLTATVGGKATFLPLLLGGIGLAAVVGLIARRRIERPLIIAGALTFAGFLYAQMVLFGGATQGLLVEPFAVLESIAGTHMNPIPTWFLTLTFALTLLSWSARAAGVLGIMSRRERWLDPLAGVLVGIVVVGTVAAFTFSQSGGGQLYFVRSVTPFIAVLSAWGAAQLLPRERATRNMALVLFGTALAGAAASTVVILAGDQVRPHVAQLGNRREVAIALVTPYVVVLAVVAALALALLLLRRRYAVLRGVSAVLVLAFVFGLGATRLIPAVRDPLRDISTHGGLVYRNGSQDGRPIADGGIEAARWLRDHSATDDRVATNAHCRKEYEGFCDNRHFWVAAFTERRVLVEGWGYTVTANQRVLDYDGTWFYLPYWNPDLLADNDRVFTQPSEASAAKLREEYGVRWLFVDERFNAPEPGLGAVATERFRSGDSVVYELR